MIVAGGSNFRKRVERAAGARSSRGAGIPADEEAELTAAEARERSKKKAFGDAARADYLVRDAMAQGKFDNLKYAGKPIPGLADVHDPDWWLKGLLQREDLSGLGPKAILLRTEDAQLDQRLDAQFTQKQVRDILEDFNARVVDARRQLQGGPPVVTRTRDIPAELQRWVERKAARVPLGEPEPERPKGRWWRRRRSTD